MHNWSLILEYIFIFDFIVHVFYFMYTMYIYNFSPIHILISTQKNQSLTQSKFKYVVHVYILYLMYVSLFDY
jgi:hypothetical protein